MTRCGKGMAVAVLAWMPVGCITVQLSGGKDEPPTFTYARPAAAAWQDVRSTGRERVYRSTSSGAVLGLSAVCDDETQAQSLDQLLDASLKGVPKLQEGARQALRANGWNGLHARAEGQRDGQRVEVEARVLRSARCAYDVVLVGAQLTESEKKAAEELTQSIREASAP